MAKCILKAALATGVDAAHPWLGSLSENAGFAAAVRAAGLYRIDPSPETTTARGYTECAREATRGRRSCPAG